MTQEEFDALPYRTVHIRIDGSDPPRALCSGEELADGNGLPRPVKQCQACFYAARRKMNEKQPAVN